MESTSYHIVYVLIGMMFYGWALWNEKHNRTVENPWAVRLIGSLSHRN